MLRIRHIVVGLALFVAQFLVVLSLVPATYAQDPIRIVTDDEVNAIAKDLYCPVCESTPLDVCPTQACADWREVIRTKLGEGQTAEEIRAYFELQYGARALAEPPRRGFTLAVWILPIAAVIVGAFAFTRYARNMRSAALPADKLEVSRAQPAPDDEYVARIERELQEM